MKTTAIPLVKTAPTIKDLAKAAGLTPAAVSMILNGRGKFKRETVERVRRLARELNYVPNANAYRLVKKETKLIGLLVPSLAEPMTVEILRGVEERTSGTDYGIVLFNTINSESREEEIYQRIARSRQVDGIVVHLFDHTERRTKQYTSHQCPCVVIEAELKELDSVSVGNYHGSVAAVEFLLKKNRTRILLVYGPIPSNIMTERKRGYEAALRKHGLRPSKSLELEVPYLTGRMYRQGVELADTLIMLADKRSAAATTEIVATMDVVATAKSVVKKSGVKPDANSSHTSLALLPPLPPLPFDAIYCAAGDEVAAGLITGLTKQGYRVPDDVSIIGFDDQPVAERVSPSLTTVRQPIREMGATAIDFLLRRIQTPDAPFSHKKFEAHLVVRESA